MLTEKIGINNKMTMKKTKLVIVVLLVAFASTKSADAGSRKFFNQQEEAKQRVYAKKFYQLAGGNPADLDSIPVDKLEDEFKKLFDSIAAESQQAERIKAKFSATKRTLNITENDDVIEKVQEAHRALQQVKALTPLLNPETDQSLADAFKLVLTESQQKDETIEKLRRQLDFFRNELKNTNRENRDE